MGRGGRFLESMIQGSKIEAEEGNLVCLAAGDKTLFDECKATFDIIAKHTLYLGKTIIL